MKLGQWLSRRGGGYVRQRAAALLGRYGIRPDKAMARVEECLATLASYGCAPTFPTPGRVVQRYPQFLRRLQEAGAELAVHSFDHVDLAAYPLSQARDQLLAAAAAFEAQGIEVHGLRCPYLSCPEALLTNLGQSHPGLFRYSSNRAIAWDGALAAALPAIGERQDSVWATLQGFYRPASARDRVATPWSRPLPGPGAAGEGGMVEIPPSLPDDLQLHDGLGLGPEGLAEVWRQVLRQSYGRGELFVLLFHPELAERCLAAFRAVLSEARRQQPAVWLARLRDVADWWQEKAGFTVDAAATASGLRLVFTCSSRATILARGLELGRQATPWDGVYQRLEAHSADAPAGALPFVGLPAGAPQATVDFLRQQGYICQLGEQAAQCALVLDATLCDPTATSQVQLIDAIEALPGPLVRYWRWPDGVRSALCITGDLDALSLLDYTSRLFVR